MISMSLDPHTRRSWLLLTLIFVMVLFYWEAKSDRDRDIDGTRDRERSTAREGCQFLRILILILVQL